MTVTDENDSVTAERLCGELVDHLLAAGVIQPGRIEAAMRAVPRHPFVPGAALTDAYADDIVRTKQDADGVVISAASQPRIVATMLDMLGVEPGHRVLEAGAGTGYNAGLLGWLVGERGQVVSVDVDDDIVTGARAALDVAGIRNVRVVRGDGADGYPAEAPYDRMIATVGVWDLPPGWLTQLAPHGRLVAPIRIRGSATRAIAFEHDGHRWRSTRSELCGFMPLRGSMADPRTMIQLAPDGSVHLEAHQDQAIDPVPLADVLGQPAVEAWTGVTLGGMESIEMLWLWLACTQPNAISAMPIRAEALTTGLVRLPSSTWRSMAITEDGNLAYLTLRPAEPEPADTPDSGRRHEIGVIGHGLSGGELAHRVAAEIVTWSRGPRGQTVEFTLQPANDGPRLDGQFLIATPHNHLAVSWL
ncbi:methyltransferase, FxLD system [Solwaraspora sp. WMMD1047]|uniref:methyltransferase, FxLD system n=1 Tax=Solwaraspora sp. WMMD1047 TaxID=3016102 RepID=UPI0024172F82|nr:methyltransferase, FxLD system [Solwaraspora sp. WMMD1047]MDG4834195.1 methyltransferase, FxLD system [Solwaraspora sp. WMMD1047]